MVYLRPKSLISVWFFQDKRLCVLLIRLELLSFLRNCRETFRLILHRFCWLFHLDFEIRLLGSLWLNFYTMKFSKFSVLLDAERIKYYHTSSQPSSTFSIFFKIFLVNFRSESSEILPSICDSFVILPPITGCVNTLFQIFLNYFSNICIFCIIYNCQHDYWPLYQ